jgi:FtsP/CotA-like multicopper oxidase with cupredoxin domain
VAAAVVQDVVQCPPGATTRIVVRAHCSCTCLPWRPSSRLLGASLCDQVNFNTTFSGEYVWHCHMLEHEDHDMMRPLVLTQ